MLKSSKPLDFSGERFYITYTLSGSESEARSLADYICTEERGRPKWGKAGYRHEADLAGFIPGIHPGWLYSAISE